MTTVYTVGYEGTNIDRFVEILKAAGIQLLADVRAVPLSRKKGFSKTALRARVESEGIAYLHFVDLGTPKAGREAAHAGRDREFREIFARHLASERTQSALLVLAGVAKDKTICLLCFERDPSACHMSIIGEWLKRRGIEVCDL